MAAALAALTFVTGCGYGLVSTRDGAGPTPVAVPLFENRTFEPFLDTRVTERVRSRVANTAAWRLVSTPDSAGLVIRGAVTGFGVTTVSFDAANRPQEQRVSLTAEIIATPPTGTPFHGSVTATAEYRETADSLDTRTAKNRAIEEAADNVANELTTRLTAQLRARTLTPRPIDPVPAAP